LIRKAGYGVNTPYPDISFFYIFSKATKARWIFYGVQHFGAAMGVRRETMIKAGIEFVLLEPEAGQLMKLNAAITSFDFVCYSSFNRVV
jgi:hypothetical protein